MDNFNYDSLESSDFSVGNDNQSSKISYAGGKKQAWPFDMRILVCPQKTVNPKPYYEVSFHESVINGNYVRIHCKKVIGEKCPLCDSFWHHKNEMTKLEGLGGAQPDSKHHEAYTQAKVMADLFKQHRRFALLCQIKDDNKVSWLDLKPQLTKSLFGDTYTKKKGAVQELQGEWKVPVYNPKEVTGWFTLSKTGEKLTTEYKARPAVVTKVVDRKKSEDLMEAPLSPMVLQKLEAGDVPDIMEEFRKKIWTNEEMHAYIESAGTEIPERFVYKKEAPVTAGSSTSNSSSDEEGFGEFDTVEDVPF